MIKGKEQQINFIKCLAKNITDKSTTNKNLYCYDFLQIRKKKVETSLVVQWLRLLAPIAGDPGSIPSQGTRSHKLQLRPNTAK